MASAATARAPTAMRGPGPLGIGPSRSQAGQCRTLQTGEHLFHEGDERRRIFVVETGWLKLTRILRSGQLQVVGFPTMGAILGLESQSEFLNDCEALTPAVVHSFLPASFLELCCRSPRSAGALIQRVGAQLGAAQAQLAAVGAQSAPQRVASFLISMSDLSGDAADEEFALPMLRRDIGGFLGLRLETVSRVISDFRRRGLIRMNSLHRCRITNRHVLSALALDSEPRSIALQSSGIAHVVHQERI
jgi:CRP-like cAMP-binding protein